jgi:hypothetical protein
MAYTKIKTFASACKALKLDPDKILPAVSPFPKNHQTALIAMAKLIIIVQALNEGWVPNWNNDNEYKYYGWFDMEKEKNNPSGFRLYGVDSYCSCSDVGSRLCFKSRELAEYAFKQKEILQLYKDFMTL